MATNEGVNKVVFGTETIIDISDSTIAPDKMTAGTVAYGADGKRIEGILPDGDTVSY